MQWFVNQMNQSNSLSTKIISDYKFFVISHGKQMNRSLMNIKSNKKQNK